MDNVLDCDIDIEQHSIHLINEDSSSAPFQPVDLDSTNWRGVPCSIPQTPQSSTAMLNHELQIARDVRKHELRQASLWTNKNYRILSQLINSLSLSQSDADRLLNAVILYIMLKSILISFALIAD